MSLNKKILLIDDDVDLREALALNLRELDLEVIEASDGEEAQVFILNTSYDLILSDIKLPHLSGIDLLRQVKKTKPVPFILMTGFSDIIEIGEAYKIGADNFLSKPFTREELVQAVEPLLKGQKFEKPNIDHHFCKIPINEFLSGSKLNIDIYIKLSSIKYLRVAAKNTYISTDRMKNYENKGLECFYVRNEDFSQYVGFNVQLSKIVTKHPDIARDKKFYILKHTTEALLQDSYINGLDKRKFSEAEEVVFMVVETMGKDENLTSLLDVINTTFNPIYAHGLGVSVYSTLVASEIGWTDHDTKMKITMGGLLHDIGEKELDVNLLKKHRHELTMEEIKLIESHTWRGRDILCELRSVPEDVVHIALQHHENGLGHGYPHGLKKEQIHPLAQLVGFINRFCELALKGPSWSPLPPLEAIDQILSFNQGEYDDVLVSALMKLFNHPGQAKLKS